MGPRLYPLVVTLTGGVGLGLALAFFVGVGLTFVPGWEDWADFFVPLALYLVLAPYALLILHLVVRNHVGRYLLARGLYEEVERYTERRLSRSPVRSRREAANHRVVHARALVGLGRLQEAREHLEPHYKTLPGTYGIEARRWLLEIALRQDDREFAQSLALTDPRKIKTAPGERAAVLACSAELALRQGNQQQYREALEEAMWAKTGHHRSRLTRALAMIQWEEGEQSQEEARQLLERLGDQLLVEIPTRASELAALHALLSWREGDQERAARELHKARALPADPWSSKVIAQVEEVISPT